MLMGVYTVHTMIMYTIHALFFSDIGRFIWHYYELPAHRAISDYKAKWMITWCLNIINQLKSVALIKAKHARKIALIVNMMYLCMLQFSIVHGKRHSPMTSKRFLYEYFFYLTYPKQPSIILITQCSGEGIIQMKLWETGMHYWCQDWLHRQHKAGYNNWFDNIHWHICLFHPMLSNLNKKGNVS